jgi:hypothetical protein
MSAGIRERRARGELEVSKKKVPELGVVIKSYHQHAITKIALPLTVTKSGKNTGYATGPRGKRYLLVRDPHNTNKIWISMRGNQNLGWI